MTSPPPFPWASLGISLVVSLALTLLIWGITYGVQKSTGYVLPWWLTLIIFLVLIFVVFYLFQWYQKSRLEKALQTVKI